ncbi:MAG: cystathionine gamma-synthase [Acidimicrobiaceae bacterium]|nr:cystathionine gamma-synthase [Acidimicrobiaceae bacterium]
MTNGDDPVAPPDPPLDPPLSLDPLLDPSFPSHPSLRLDPPDPPAPPDPPDPLLDPLSPMAPSLRLNPLRGPAPGSSDRPTPALDPSTLAVHLGRPGAPGAPVNAAVELSATFRAGGDQTYGRDDNLTWVAFEAALGGLEGGTALAFGSGMAAIAAVLETVPVGGWVVVAGDAYNGTRRFLSDAAARGRLAVRSADVADTDATLAMCEEVSSAPNRRASGGMLWLESPTNPLLAIADLPALIDGGHRLGLTVAVDNTFASPLLQSPLQMGADVVVHSVTKLISGHSDVLLGAAVTRSPELLEQLRTRRSLHGAIPGPMETFLALRGLRTLAVRLERSQASAADLAERLMGRHGVGGVLYPGLADHPGHKLAARQMRGFGTMLAFEVTGGAEAAELVCQSVQLITPGTSLGGVESLIERRARWSGESHLPPALLRLSVGLEHPDDLWWDLDQAFARANVT